MTRHMNVFIYKKSRNKCINYVMLILMDGRIKQPDWSAETKPGQLCCFINVHLFFLPAASRVILMSYQSDSHLCLESRGSEGGGTTRCPCWQRCIKTRMSHRSCRAHLTASKGGSSVPLSSPPLQSAPSFPRLPSTLLSISVIRRWGIRHQH